MSVEEKVSLPGTDFPILKFYQDPAKIMLVLTAVNLINLDFPDQQILLEVIRKLIANFYIPCVWCVNEIKLPSKCSGPNDIIA